MKCYYEELGIARDANDGDIKTAYRKLALKWHPDKNLDSLEEAKERFQLIQQAYEVLSDPQERAWYDNHREQILRGKNSEYEDKSLDVFQYFTSSCFKGYGDDDKGFYAVYREVFNKLAAEDAEFMDEEDELDDIPSFGDSQSDYEEVVGPFYAYWSTYSTKKTYEWLCPYDIREIKERRILRAVEKEMKKIVTNAKKERNEEIRNLVAFIRKRDKRVHARRIFLEEKAEQNRLKQEQNRLEKIKKRQKELEEMRKNSSQIHNDDYEEQLKNLELEYVSEEEDEDDDDSEEELEENSETADSPEEYFDDLYCVACNKSFKNDRALQNHESSKKHKENIERLRNEMEAEENDFNNSRETEDLDEEELLEETDFKSDLASDDEAQQVEIQASSSKRKNKKAKKNKPANLPKPFESEDEVAIETKSQEEPEEEDLLAKERLGLDSDDEENWNKSSNKKGSKKTKNKKQVKKLVDPAPKEPKEEKPPTKPSIEKTKKHLSESDPDDKPDNFCVTCKAVFPSKNKLFAHLKSSGHAVYLGKSNPPPESSKSKKGKKR